MSSPSNEERANEPPASLGSGSASTPIGDGAAAPDDAAPQSVSEPPDILKLKPLVVEAVSKVYDPEIPVNIYELGLIYDIAIDPSAAVEIRMTLTAPGCPAAFMLPLEVDRRVREVPGVTAVRVELVWDPPWDPHRMSEAARLQLGLY
jgi:FeS assembly SUF system protein